MNTTVRRVLPHEYSKYKTHLKSLDPESRILRFGYPATDEIIDRLCEGIEADKDHHILFCVEDSHLDFVGIGHIALDHDGMELAFSVLKDHQGQGIGNSLMHRCIQWCRTHGILKGCMVCLSTNAKIKHLCSKYGIKMVNDHGETLANIELDRPTPGTYIEEVADVNLAVLDWVGKRTLLPWTILAEKG